MEPITVIQLIFGSITSLLLSVVAYFIKQLHSDFRRMEMDISEVKTTTMLIKTEFKSSYDYCAKGLNTLRSASKLLKT